MFANMAASLAQTCQTVSTLPGTDLEGSGVQIQLENPAQGVMVHSRLGAGGDEFRVGPNVFKRLFLSSLPGNLLLSVIRKHSYSTFRVKNGEKISIKQRAMAWLLTAARANTR